MTAVRYTRQFQDGDEGGDVKAVGRALAKARYLSGLAYFADKPEWFQRRWNRTKQGALRRFKIANGLSADYAYTKTAHERLSPFFDAYGRALMLGYRPPPQIVFPIGEGMGGGICQGLHETAGIEGNWAIDVCASAGTGILAVETGWIDRLSGRDPNTDVPDDSGAFGWSTYFLTSAGYRYFVTHLGWRAIELQVGLKVMAGDLLGKVGDQEFRPDHVHYGVASPFGERDAKKRITQVANAPRLH